MKNLLLAVLFGFVFTSTASAQVEATVETGGAVPTVKVWHPGFDGMCKTLAAKLEVPAGTEAIQLQPKSLPPSRARYLGDVWVARLRTREVEKEIEVSASELPSPLHGIRGQAAHAIFRGSCSLKDGFFYSTEDMVFVVISNNDAVLLRDAIR